MVLAVVREREERTKAHEALRASPPYPGVMTQISRLLRDYGLGVNAIALMATRRRAYFDELISLRIKPHFVQSMIAASHLISEGLHDPARREMRFLVEASVKALWLDRGGPPLAAL